MPKKQSTKKSTPKNVCLAFINALKEEQNHLLSNTTATKSYPDEPDHYATLTAADGTTTGIANRVCVLTGVRWDIFAKGDKVLFTFSEE